MIVQTRENKDLVIPKSLGNFVTEGSGGGMTPEEVEEMIDSAITEYNIELEVELEDIREAVSANTQDIETLSGTTSALTSSVDNLLDAVTGLTEGFENLSGSTSALTENLNALSGSVETLSQSLSAYTTTNTFNAGISGLTGQISGVSEDVEELSGKTGEVYDAIFYEDEGETYSQIDDLWEAVEGKQDAFEAGSGISFNGDVLSLNPPAGCLSLSESGRLQLNVGSGLTIGEEYELNVKIGEGLGFSGDTLVVSGATGGGPQIVYLNKLSQQELLDLYDTIWSYYDDSTESFTSAWTEDLYEFYIDLRDNNDQQAYSVNDHYEGLFPMQVTRCHPSDYGGAVFFTGVEGDREGNGILINIRFVIAADGSVDAGTWWNRPAPDAEPRGAYIVISDASGTPYEWNIGEVDYYLAQWNDRNMGAACFNMFLCYTAGDAERYRGSLVNFRKNYNNVNGNYFFRFILDIDGTEYEAEYYYDSQNDTVVKIVFQTYKAYLQSVLNS